MNAYMDQYKSNQIQTASPEQILIMLYDGAVRFTRQAMQAMDSGDKTTQGEKISRTMAILCEFSNTLDHDIGGKIAADLDALYSFMTRELSRANLEGDRKALEVVEKLLVELRETWVEASKISLMEKQGKAAGVEVSESRVHATL